MLYVPLQVFLTNVNLLSATTLQPTGCMMRTVFSELHDQLVSPERRA